MDRRFIAAMLATCVAGSVVLAADSTSRQSPTTAPSTNSMMEQLLSPGNTRQLPNVTSGAAKDATGGGAAVVPNAPVVSVQREGTYIINRMGRLTKSPDGQQSEFTFDSDGKALKDPPVIILPNLKLMQMEAAVAGYTRDLKFRVSGMLTEYKGRNYILLDKVVVVQEQDQKF